MSEDQFLQCVAHDEEPATSQDVGEATSDGKDD
jgi:hypothetical protein